MRGENREQIEGHETERPAVAISNLVRREIQTPVAACLLRGFVEALGYEQAMQIASAAIQGDARLAGKMMVERVGGNTMADLLRVVREIWADYCDFRFVFE